MQQLRSFKPQSLGCAVARRKSSTTLIFPLPPQACSGKQKLKHYFSKILNNIKTKNPCLLLGVMLLAQKPKIRKYNKGNLPQRVTKGLSCKTYSYTSMCC